MQVGRRSVFIHPIALMALTLALAALCRAQGGAAAVDAGLVSPDQMGTDVPTKAEANVSPELGSADVPKARVPRTQTHRIAGQGIDETVRRMSRGLGLDVGQQMQLRQILLNQQQQMRKLRAEPPPSGVAWPAVAMGIADQTKARIRAMLTTEQKEKYTTDVPREMTGPAQADLQHWMRIQESNRRKDDEDAK